MISTLCCTYFLSQSGVQIQEVLHSIVLPTSSAREYVVFKVAAHAGPRLYFLGSKVEGSSAKKLEFLEGPTANVVCGLLSTITSLYPYNNYSGYD